MASEYLLTFTSVPRDLWVLLTQVLSLILAKLLSGTQAGPGVWELV